MRQHDERDLGTVLREEAERHRPDRAVMLDRITRARAEQARRPMHRAFTLLRPAAAALAVAVVLVLAIAGVRLGDQGPEVDPAPAAAPSAVAPPSAAPATTSPPAPRASASSGATTRTTEPATPGRDGFLSSAGVVDPNSNQGWAQGNVVLENTRTITALDVRVNVAMTPGLTETGRWSTVPANLLTVSSSRKGDVLVFRFTLAKGATLAPGKYTFAVQFNHAAGRRSAAGDTYAAGATGGGKNVQVSGGFRTP